MRELEGVKLNTCNLVVVAVSQRAYVQVRVREMRQGLRSYMSSSRRPTGVPTCILRGLTLQCSCFAAVSDMSAFTLFMLSPHLRRHRQIRGGSGGHRESVRTVVANVRQQIRWNIDGDVITLTAYSERLMPPAQFSTS